MCLGAKGTYIGRAFLYGLGALGKEGVTKALNIIKTEADMTMALCGRRDVHDLSRDNIRNKPAIKDVPNAPTKNIDNPIGILNTSKRNNIGNK